MKRIIIIAVLLLISGSSLAQQGTTSPYSFYGMGTTNFKGTAENRAMGGLGVATDSIRLNLLNPASLAELQLVNFTLGMGYQRTNQKVGGETQTATTTTFDYLAVGIPVGKFGVSFGLMPSTSVGYDLTSSSGDNHMEYQGEGGVNKTFLAFGFSIMENWNIGLEAGYNFGSIKNTGVSRQLGVNYATQEQNEFDLSGFNFQLGTDYTLPLENGKYLKGSLTYTPKYSMSTENNRILESIIYSFDGSHVSVDRREFDMVEGNMDVAEQYSFGLGYGLDKHWFVGAELSHRGAENFNTHSLALDNVKFSDSKAYRLGGYYIPNYRALSGVFKRVSYRMGIRYEELGLNINGQNIDEFGISFGVGVPMTRTFSNINLGIELGKRGTNKNGLIQENFINAILTLSLNDKWFQKRYIY